MTQTLPLDDVRTRILHEATALFAAKGCDATSLSTIADAAGITKPTLVYHFKNKAGLRRAVLGQMLEHWKNELPRLMMAAASGGPRLDNLLGALFGFFLEDRNRARLVLREMLDAPDNLRDTLRDELQPWTRLIAEAIRTGQSAGTLRPDADPEAYTLVLITTAIGILAAGDRTNALLAPEPPIEAQLHEIIRLARVGLLPPRPVEN